MQCIRGQSCYPHARCDSANDNDGMPIDDDAIAIDDDAIDITTDAITDAIAITIDAIPIASPIFFPIIRKIF